MSSNQGRNRENAITGVERFLQRQNLELTDEKDEHNDDADKDINDGDSE